MVRQFHGFQTRDCATRAPCWLPTLDLGRLRSTLALSVHPVAPDHAPALHSPPPAQASWSHPSRLHRKPPGPQSLEAWGGVQASSR